MILEVISIKIPIFRILVELTFHVSIRMLKWVIYNSNISKFRYEQQFVSSYQRHADKSLGPTLRLESP